MSLVISIKDMKNKSKWVNKELEETIDNACEHCVKGNCKLAGYYLPHIAQCSTLREVIKK